MSNFLTTPTAAEIDEAGETLRSDVESTALFRARMLVQSWRGRHERLIAAFRSIVEEASTCLSHSPIIAARLKRLPTIVDKLQRYPDIKLSEMQDIVGLRAIVTDRVELGKIRSAMPREAGGLRYVGESDYLKRPKKSGYGGVHLIYQYHAQGQEDRTIDGLRVELQLRTHNQHTWATANEVVGTFRGEMLKSGIGDPEWLRFFVLAGSAVAIKDGGKPGTNVPQNYAALRAEVDALKTKLNVYGKLSGYSAVSAVRFPDTEGKPSYFVITYNHRDRTIDVSGYGLPDIGKAIVEYRKREEAGRSDARMDTVLVRSESIKELREAYPNYFTDCGDFLSLVYSHQEFVELLQEIRNVRQAKQLSKPEI